MTNARKLYKDIRPIGIALLFSLIAAALSACGAPASTQATSCENLSSVKLEHAVISSARAVPRVARWNGKGSTDAAENFTCL